MLIFFLEIKYLGNYQSSGKEKKKTRKLKQKAEERERRSHTATDFLFPSKG